MRHPSSAPFIPLAFLLASLAALPETAAFRARSLLTDRLVCIFRDGGGGHQFVESIALTYFNLRLRPPSMLDNIMGMLGGMPK